MQYQIQVGKANCLAICPPHKYPGCVAVNVYMHWPGKDTRCADLEFNDTADKILSGSVLIEPLGNNFSI